MTYSLTHMATAVRMLSVEMIEKAKSGHPGMPLGMADIATVLWTKFLKFDATCPTWFNRDRFILSNGHGSALLYSLMYLTGFPDVTLDEIKNFRQWGSKTAGHPEKTLIQGIDFSTGPLGQGIAGGVGMALAERILNARYGDDIVNHKTYVFVGDGCLMEGVSEEAIALAGHLSLRNLIVLWDNNRITIDGQTDITTSTDMKKRFEANQWLVLSCDGHDFQSIETALATAQTATKPVLIDCRTTIGYQAPTKGGTPKCHGSPLGSQEIIGLKQALNWAYEPFIVPNDILSAWRQVGQQFTPVRQVWETTLQDASCRDNFIRDINWVLPNDLQQLMMQEKQRVLDENKAVATRKSSESTLNLLSQHVPFLVGGSADLAGACYTKPTNAHPISATDYNGNYIHYGIREHAMGAIMNGLSAHGGILPFGGTFLSFVDYMKPAVRLGALMDLPVWYVLTHDSIGVGEDGPTHQPIEQLLSLRATPNVFVFRPCDGIETIECYECMLQRHTGPSALICSRQALPVLRTDISDNKTVKGGYILSQSERCDITLIATGSEVSLAVSVATQLRTQGFGVTVVSMPCLELFEQQSAEYQQSVLGQGYRFVIEAGSTAGWYKYISDKGAVFGIDCFGSSAPGSVLQEKYGFTTQNIMQRILDFMK